MSNRNAALEGISRILADYIGFEAPEGYLFCNAKGRRETALYERAKLILEFLEIEYGVEITDEKAN